MIEFRWLVFPSPRRFTKSVCSVWLYWERVSLCSSDEPWTHHPPASAFQVLRLQQQTTVLTRFVLSMSWQPLTSYLLISKYILSLSRLQWPCWELTFLSLHPDPVFALPNPFLLEIDSDWFFFFFSFYKWVRTSDICLSEPGIAHTFF